MANVLDVIAPEEYISKEHLCFQGIPGNYVSEEMCNVTIVKERASPTCSFRYTSSAVKKRMVKPA